MLRIAIMLTLILSLVTSRPAWSQQDQVAQQVANLPWQSYPSIGRMGSVARISLKGDLRFLDSVATRRFLELNGNPPRDNQYTFAPRNLSWFVICAFDPSGYVRDDEHLDQDELLKTLQKQNETGIEERRRLKLAVMRLNGWAIPPHYDVQTRRLEWGTRLVNDNGETTVNYLSRILGRTGVMSMILVSDPESLDINIREFHAALHGFDYVEGERYSEFRQGDHTAAYGLGALIVGGAAAAAASSGVLKGFGKFIGLAVLAGLAAIGSFFKKLFGRKAS